jgi:hypothetical protein
VGLPPTETVVPLGTDTVALAPGSDTEALPLGTDAEALAPGSETEALPLGTDTVALAPGNETEALPPGSETEALPPGTVTVAVPPGTETVTGLDPVPRAGRPVSPPVAGVPPCWAAGEPEVDAGCCGLLELGGLPADVPAEALPAWRPVAGSVIPVSRVNLGRLAAVAGPLRCRVVAFGCPSARVPWRPVALTGAAATVAASVLAARATAGEDLWAAGGCELAVI